MASARDVGWSFSPLDEELGLGSERFTPKVVQAIVRLGTLTSFSEAGAVLRLLLGVEVAKETSRRVTETTGRGLVEAETKQAVELSKSLAQPAVQVVDRLQQVSVDGAMVPLLRGEWSEAKTVAIGRILPAETCPKAEALTYFSRLADHQTFSDQARLEFWRRGTEAARAVVAVTDVAEWIPSFLDDHCPGALQIIDWVHAAGYVIAAGQALFGPGPADCSAWVGAQLHTLWTGDPETVVAALAEVETSSGLEAVRTARQYLSKRLNLLRYAAFRAAGYPVGSGIVESANKVVVEARLKGRGRHWARANVDPILALRCAAASDAWSERWESARAARRKEHRHKRLPAPPPPKPLPPQLPIMSTYVPAIVNGKPTRAHPWKTYVPPRAKS